MVGPVPADYWRFFSEEAGGGGSPLYGHIALGIRDDEKLKAIAAHARPGQPPANLIFGAVHYLMLGGVADPLADHYPSIRPEAKPTGDAFPLFRAFVLKHQAEITRIIKARVTNTNEVARSTTLYPAFDFIARETGAELHMIEIGPSAGFNLNWDRYAYHYMRNAAVAIAREPHGAHLTLEAELHGDATPPFAPTFPRVASRIGLELNPVDLNKPEDRLWLKALIWPELTRRHARLGSAITTALSYPHRIWAGDAVELLPNAIRELPPSGLPVVYHSHVTYQFTPELRRRLNELLEAHAKARPIYRVSIEWDGEGYPIAVGRYENGSVDRRVIATCHHHGAWLQWR